MKKCLYNFLVGLFAIFIFASINEVAIAAPMDGKAGLEIKANIPEGFDAPGIAIEFRDEDGNLAFNYYLEEENDFTSYYGGIKAEEKFSVSYGIGDNQKYSLKGLKGSYTFENKEDRSITVDVVLKEGVEEENIIEVDVTEEQKEAMNELPEEETDKSCYVTKDVETVKQEFMDATSFLTDEDLYKAVIPSIGSEPYLENIPGLTQEEYENATRYEKFCWNVLVVAPSNKIALKNVESLEAFISQEYIGEYIGALKDNEDVLNATLKVWEWHYNNYDMFGVFLNPYDTGVVENPEEEKEQKQQELQQKNEEEIEQVVDELEETYGADIDDTDTDDYEESLENEKENSNTITVLIISNVIAWLLLLGVGGFFLVRWWQEKRLYK